MSLLLQCELRRRFYINDRAPVTPKSLFALTVSEWCPRLWQKGNWITFRRAHVMHGALILIFYNALDAVGCVRWIAMGRLRHRRFTLDIFA